MQRSTAYVVGLFLACGLVAAGAGATEPAELEGRWEGAILFAEGRTELDMVAVFQHSAEGGWTAVLDMPLVGVRGLEVEKVQTTDDGVDLTFDMDDGMGTRTITAHLVGDDTIEGQFNQGTQSYPLYLARQDTPEELEDAEVVELFPPGKEELRRRFNAQRGAVRLVLLLSPS